MGKKRKKAKRGQRLSRDPFATSDALPNNRPKNLPLQQEEISNCIKKLLAKLQNAEAMSDAKHLSDFQNDVRTLQKKLYMYSKESNPATWKSHYDLYKEAYKQNNMEKCVQELLSALFDDSAGDFRKAVFRSNSIKNPMGMKYTQQDYDKTMTVLETSIAQAKEEKFPKEKITVLYEFLIYTFGLYKNNKINSERLDANSLFLYPLSQQMRMICIFIQDQALRMQDNFFKTRKMSSAVWATDAAVATLPVDNMPNVYTSIQDNYEGMLDRYGKLFSYIFFRSKGVNIEDDISRHGDLHPFEKVELEEASYLAAQRSLYLGYEEKIRYYDWRISPIYVDFDGKSPTEAFAICPVNKRQYLCHRTAAVRRFIKAHDDTLRGVVELNLAPRSSLDKMIEVLELNDIESFHLDWKAFDSIRKLVEPKVFSFRKNPYYQLLSFRGAELNHYLDMYVYLSVFGKIYIGKVLQIFDEQSKSDYKYLAPIINKSYFIQEFARLFQLNIEESESVLNCFLFTEKGGRYGGDIFSRPLIAINSENVLFCDELVETLNVDRAIEMLAQEQKLNLSEWGTIFEDLLRKKLMKADHIQINPTSIFFHASDGDVEFDCIGTMDDHLILIECKRVLTPYDPIEVYERWERIKEGVEQVKRRRRLVQNEADWAEIRRIAKISLPEKPFASNKIIGIVCTNIGDFTSMQESNVFLTDDSVLLKYFTDPQIGGFVIQKTESASPQIEQVYQRSLWAESKPTVSEFKRYLTHPPTLTSLMACFEKQKSCIPSFSGQMPVIVNDYVFAKKPSKIIFADAKQGKVSHKKSKSKRKK